MSTDDAPDERTSRPPMSRLQAMTFALTAVVLLAGTCTYLVVGRGYIVVLTGLCATAVVVAGMARDLFRRRPGHSQATPSPSPSSSGR